MGAIRKDPSSATIQFKPSDKGPIGSTSDLQFNNAGGIKERIEQAASREDADFSSDDMKYAVAVKTAQDRLSGHDGVDDDAMKAEIDKIYEQELGAGEGAGREKRGENLFTDAVGGLKGFIDDATLGAGNIMDGIFDNTIGNLAGLVGGEEYGNTVKNAFSGDDLQIVADIASDVALAAIPGAGIPLVVAKNLAQNSDDLAEAISGRDNLTLEGLDGWQRFGKGAGALGSAALSAFPGIGKAKNLSDYGKAVSESAKKSADALAEAQKGISKDDLAWLKDVPSVIDSPLSKQSQESAMASAEMASRMANKLDPITKAIDIRIPDERTINPAIALSRYGKKLSEGMKGAKQTFMPADEKTRKAASESLEAAKEALSKAKGEDGKDAIKAAREAVDRAKYDKFQAGFHPIAGINKARDAINPMTGSLSDRLAQQKSFEQMLEALADPKTRTLSEVGKDIGPQLKRSLKGAGANAATLVPMMTLSGMGEYGGDPTNAFGNAAQIMAQDPEKLFMSLVPIGARGMARKSPTLKGRPGGAVAYPAVRAGAVSDEIGSMSEGNIEEGYDEDEIARRLDAIMLKGNSNG